ncbi:MAG: SDR family oxidoreductase [Gemmatimonadetes bacterium]|nr:SDR family oxidoreductase [Gemmatimonadota bacterium]MYD26963.1 SDR family oxidoreductase [Gemmatimonadota bacterium]MYI98991.1 SDR family oxidoreductase [Gemmatimonadota bacterium]
MASMGGKVVVVTGASTGIGQSAAEAFAREGATVVLTARSEGRLERIAADIEKAGGRAVPMAVDVTDRSAVFEKMKEIAASQGSIDVLVNNAGIGLLSPVEGMDPEELKRIFDVNFFGLIWCTQAVLPHMIKQKSGRIVNISSVAGKRALPHISAYCASKFAVQAFSDSLRMEVAEHGITVTVLCPPRVDTTFHDTPLMRQKGQRMSAPSISAEYVAAAIVRAARRGSREVVVSFYGKFFVFFHWLSPRLLEWIMKHLWMRLDTKKTERTGSDEQP